MVSISLETVNLSKRQYLKLLIKLVVCLLKQELTGTLEVLGYCSGKSILGTGYCHRGVVHTSFLYA